MGEDEKDGSATNFGKMGAGLSDANHGILYQALSAC